MSALTGIPGTNGRITTTAGAASILRRAMGFDASGALCIVASAGGGFFNGTVMINAAGAVMSSLVNAIASYTSGLPLDSNGGLCTEAAAAVTFVQGVGLTAAGRIAVN